MINQYEQYNNPYVMIWRKGTDDDPYVLRTDSLPIINGQITLLEIPSEKHKVKISGFIEIDDKHLIKNNGIIGINEFKVNYTNGSIQFNPLHEGKVLMVEYYGRGIIMYPASRIYAMVERSPDIIKTLQDIIDECLKHIDENKKLISEINIIIQNAINATNDTNTAIDNANLARDQALQAANIANQATQDALNAADSSIMIYKEPVPTYDDLFIIYPEPENGWRVMITETGDIYRYDGIVDNEWKLIGNYTGGSIPFVSDTTDGLLRSEDYRSMSVKNIIFAMPRILYSGIQNYIIQFPYDGEILNVYAFCVTPSTLTPTEIQIEKISAENFGTSNWEALLDTTIFLNANEQKGTEPTILNPIVNKNDYFRINVLQLDSSIRGVTVQIDVKLK